MNRKKKAHEMRRQKEETIENRLQEDLERVRKRDEDLSDQEENQTQAA